MRQLGTLKRAGVLVYALTAVFSTGCSSAATNDTTPTTEKPPAYVGQPGVPIHATARNGATADITLDSVSWMPQWPCAVFELTIVGTSTQPFKYVDDDITAGYGGGSQPWTHPDDGNFFGPDLGVDYSAINKVPPLRSGQLTVGQTAHGFVAIRLSTEAEWYVKVADPDDSSNIEAGWAVRTRDSHA